MNRKYKYVYDKKSGHFVKRLFEDDSNNVTTDTQQSNTNNSATTSNNSDDTSVNKSFKSVESDEVIQKLNTQISDNNKKFQDELNNNQKLLDAAKVTASNKTDIKGIYDPVATDSNVLNLMKKINDLKKNHYIQIADLENQKITQLQALSQKNESYYRIPDKYKGLNESNIHTAKVYMKNLIAQDEDHILKGMNDFKRVFKNTDLLYGKDREGYFVVAVDSEDFNKLYDTLEEVGYLRDEIIDTVMPQLFDRSNMIQ